ncbi:unnamed protein product [Brachionus calyciflorus]|uniref:Uncharacterized protein n=1 Tax=Brachionus calyciflorus TaxID=104777 RepID=A0A814A412_9BILA|nr:unnamed protein product [Brachionus calyciflorus]
MANDFSDLNLNVTNLNDNLIDQLVENAIKLGYDNLALSIDFEFPNVASIKSKDQKKKESKPQLNIPTPKAYKLPPKIADRLNLLSKKINLFSRINIKIKPNDINTYLHHLKSKAVMNFDIIALEPVDSQVLLYLCSNNFNADIISITSGIDCGLTDKHLTRPLNNAVSAFGLTFELNYSPSISSSTERRDFIMAGRCLTFNTKSKGLIISSGASNSLNLRGPYELLNLVKLFDINERESHQIIRHTPHQVITNSFCRKHTSAGMVYINDTNDLKKLGKALVLYQEKLKQEKLNRETEKVNGNDQIENLQESPKKKFKN